jgi:hypothetical protein
MDTTNLPPGSRAHDVDEGCIKLYTGDGMLHICVRRYRHLVWIQLGGLSASTWMKYRTKIHTQLSTLNLGQQEERQEAFNVGQAITINTQLWENKKLIEDIHRESLVSTQRRQQLDITERCINSLLKTMDSEQISQWLKNNTEFKNTICHDCCNYEMNLVKKKCIHLDCCGMCKICFEKENPEGFEVCACCHKKQELTCPICLDEHKLENMVKSDSCSHHVCWKCFGLAIKSSNPLIKCPLCRKIFCDNIDEETWSVVEV